MALTNISAPTAKSDQPGSDIGPGTVLIERFLIEEALEESDSARVYAAEHLFLRKKLVVKILPRERPDVEELRGRFEREAMLAARLDHAHLASAVDFGSLPDGTPFFVMEHAQGKNLRAALAEGPLPLARSLHIAHQVARALTGLRELDLVHGDLRPENVMLMERNGDADFVKVLNLGLASLRVNADGPAKRLPYLAPEQVLDAPIDTRADLYALGVMLFEMLTGKHPYKTPPSANQPAEAAPTFAELAPDVQLPRDVEQLVQRLISRNVDERLSSAQAALDALANLLKPLRNTGTKLAAAAHTAVIAKPSSPPEMAFSKSTPPPPPLRQPRLSEARGSAPPPPPIVSAAPAIAPSPVVAAQPVAAAPAAEPPAPVPTAAAASVAGPPPAVAPPPAAVPAPIPAPAPPAGVAAPPALAASSAEEPPSAIESLVDEDDDAPTRLALPKVHLPHRASSSPSLSPSSPPPASPEAATVAQSITPPMGQATPAAARKDFWAELKAQQWPKKAKDRAELAYLDASITFGQWRDRARERLKGRKGRLVASTAAGAGLGLLVIGFFALRSPSPAEPETSSVHSAVGAETVAAESEKSTPVHELETSKAPAPKSQAAGALAPTNAQDETAVFLNLANTYANEHRDTEAVALVSRELLRHPELKSDSRIAAVLSRTVRSDSRQAADESFAQLSGAMGAAGAEIIYGVASDTNVRDSLRKRSEDWLSGKDFDRNSSAALYSAVKLRYAKNCEQKRALLPLAADVGGKQTLEYLREIDSRVICRPSDLSNCYPCMAGDSRLKDAIQRIEKRLAARD